MNVFVVLLCRGGGGINEWERLKARVEDWRLTGGWVEGGGAAKVKVEATPPPPPPSPSYSPAALAWRTLQI